MPQVPSNSPAPATYDLTGPILYHGTNQEIHRSLCTGYDGVLWMSDQPKIAQTYIKMRGAKSTLHAPTYMSEKHVVPNQNCLLANLACELTGEDIFKRVGRKNHIGEALTFSIASNHPRYGQVFEYIEQHGYKRVADCYTIWVEHTAGRTKLLRQDATTHGQLFLIENASPQDLKYFDLRTSSEPDLTEYQHLDIRSFAKIEALGYDGVIINDFAQAEGEGNIPHVSYGLFARALDKIKATGIPARPYLAAPNETWAGPTADLIAHHNNSAEHEQLEDLLPAA